MSASNRRASFDREAATAGPLPLQLLALPSSFLAQVVEALDGPACQGFFRTSTECRDLALAFGRVTYVPSLDVGKLQTSGLLKQSSALQLLSRSGPQTRLALRRTRRLETSLLPRAVVDALQAAEAALSTAAALTLLQCATRTLQRPLSALQNVQLSGLEMPALVPDWLTATCPNLRTLQMEDCTFSPGAAADAVTQASSSLSGLQALTLSPIPTASNDTGVATISDESQTAMCGWARQLEDLTGLRSFVSLRNTHCPWPLLERLASATGRQLTTLVLGMPKLSAHLPALTRSFPHLTTLAVPLTTINDDSMDALLAMHGLMHVDCHGFRLSRDYSEGPCSWTHMRITPSWHDPRLDLQQLARVPLRSLRHIGFCTHGLNRLTIVPLGDSATMQRVAADVAGCVDFGPHAGRGSPVPCGAMHLSSSVVVDACTGGDVTGGDATTAHAPLPASPMMLCVVSETCMCDWSAVACIAPIARRVAWSHLQLANVTGISATSLAELQTWAAPAPAPGPGPADSNSTVAPSSSELTLANCTWAEDAWPALFTALPSSVTRVYLRDTGVGAVTEDRLTKACVSAGRAAELYVWAQGAAALQAGWQQRGVDAMAAAGHNHVALFE